MGAVTRAQNGADIVAVALVTVVFAATVGATALLGGALPSRLDATSRTVLARLGGLLLTTIGLSALVTNVTKIAMDAGLEV